MLKTMKSKGFYFYGHCYAIVNLILSLFQVRIGVFVFVLELWCAFAFYCFVVVVVGGGGGGGGVPPLLTFN